jgi:hypothetical protein
MVVDLMMPVESKPKHVELAKLLCPCFKMDLGIRNFHVHVKNLGWTVNLRFGDKILQENCIYLISD